jgi:hypothetical protein
MPTATAVTSCYTRTGAFVRLGMTTAHIILNISDLDLDPRLTPTDIDTPGILDLDLGHSWHFANTATVQLPHRKPKVR